MKKRTLGLVAIGVTSVGLVGGGTYANWSDFAIRPESVKAGHLTLVVDGTDLSDSPLQLVPGEHRFFHFHLASNDGESVPDGELSVQFQNLEHLENGCQNTGEADAEGNGDDIADEDLGAACGTTGELADETEVRWHYVPAVPDVDCSTIDPNAMTEITPTASLRDHEGGPARVLGTLAPGEGTCVSIEITAVEQAGNDVHIDEIQGDAVDFDLRFALTQT